MADRKISDLTALTTPASGDYLPIVDISEAAAASKNKRITIEELMRGMPDGTAAAPSIAFESDPNTGIYRPGADQLAISTNGTGRLTVDTAATTSTLPVVHPLGAVGTPSITFTGDLNTGVYSPGADQVAISTGGTQKFAIDSLNGNPIIENEFPVVAPSLDLAFALTKQLDPRVTFTRASSGTFVGSNGVLQTASTDVPRFDHNPTTGESLGLLVEEQRTNLLLRSEEFDNASWTKSGLLAFGSGSTANAIAAPSGAVSADLLTEDTTTAEHFTEQNFSTVSGTTYAFSVFVKAGTGKTTIVLRLTTAAWSGGANNQVLFNLSTGVSTILVGSPVALSQSFGNGWWRFTIVSTASSTGTPAARIHLTDSSGNTNYTGDGTSGIYLWGAQLEDGAFPTSYISTTTAAVTRSADVASITGTAFSSWYRQDEGSIYALGAPRYTYGGVNSFPRVFSISNNTTTTMIDGRNRVLSSFSDSGYAVADGGVTQATYDSASNTAGQAMCIAYKANSFAFSIGGVLSDSDTSGTVPTVDRMILGNIPGGTYTLNGTIRRLTYWPTRLLNSTLQAVTQ